MCELVTEMKSIVEQGSQVLYVNMFLFSVIKCNSVDCPWWLWHYSNVSHVHSLLAVVFGSVRLGACCHEATHTVSTYKHINTPLHVMGCHGCRSERGPKCRHYCTNYYLIPQTRQAQQNTDQTVQSHTGNETNRVYIHRQGERIGQRGTRHRWTQ